MGRVPGAKIVPKIVNIFVTGTFIDNLNEHVVDAYGSAGDSAAFKR